MHRRIAFVIGLALLLSAFAVGFAPNHVRAGSSISQCGTWWSPYWNESDMDQVGNVETLDDYGDATIKKMNKEFIRNERVADQFVSESYLKCNISLEKRRNFSVALLALAVFIPGAVLFVGRSRRRMRSNRAAVDPRSDTKSESSWMLRCPSCGAQGPVRGTEDYFRPRGVWPHGHWPVVKCRNCDAGLVVKPRVLPPGVRARVIPSETWAKMTDQWTRAGMDDD